MRRTKLVVCLLLLQFFAQAQFTVSANKRYLLKNGQPFFWLGDTAWELFHRLTLDETRYYLQTRQRQGFTVIQAVALAELDGLNTPNAAGDKPLLNNDPSTPNEKYFAHVDAVITLADSLGLTIALLPTWGDKVWKHQWGAGPEIFNAENAAVYGSWIAARYKTRTNLIWMLGGDRNPRHDSDVTVWRSMARAIQRGTSGKALITFHPQATALGSAEWFHGDDWLSFNVFQNGHCRGRDVYNRVQTVYNLKPTKPVLDAEPIYEDHPVCFNAADQGTSSAYDVRWYAYLDLFAGAFGHTYGCHGVWQMWAPGREGVNGPHLPWREALDLPGANQMQWVRKLMESHPLLERVPDQNLLVESNLSAPQRIQATRGSDYLFVYSAWGLPFTVKMEKIKASRLQAYWFDPRTGKTSDAGTVKKRGLQKFTPPTTGYGEDWVLVVDDAAKYKRL